MEGAMIGAAGGITLANVAMALAVPTVGVAVAANLSIIAGLVGSVEGARYFLGSDKSLLVKASNYLNYLIKRDDKSHDDMGIIDINYDESDAVMFDAMPNIRDLYDSDTLSIVTNYCHLPHLKIIDESDMYFDVEQDLQIEEADDAQSWELVEFGGQVLDRMEMVH
jgi:hypothetical protein